MNERHWGLDPGQLDRIRAVLAAHPKITKAIIYGSRALGTNRSGSDIDLTLAGELHWADLNKVGADLDALDLPYTVDLSLESQIENPALRQHIEQHGQVLYTREPART